MSNLGVWYDPRTWLDTSTGVSPIQSMAASAVLGTANRFSADQIEAATGFFTGQIANGLEKEKSDQHKRYRDLRDARALSLRMTGRARAEADNAFRQAKAALDDGTNKLNAAVKQHDQLVVDVKSKAFVLAGSEMPDIQKVYTLSPPTGGLSGLGVAPVVGVFAWIASNPISFTITAVAATILVSILATYFFVAFSSLLALIAAMLSVQPGMERLIDRFKQTLGVVTEPVKKIAYSIAAIGGVAVIGLLGVMYLRNRKT